ncbi:50S ribosomal protein L4 [Parafrigoribacterium mesophilum]|uniref:50S ribosomal protein L4 n=1 Tax=Parafrigoribacterium mesophilum TaxID=433646 RepID=UPI0031FDF1E5
MASATTPDTAQLNVSQLNVIDAKGKTVGTVDLPADTFDVPTNVPLIHQVVVAQRAAARQGTANTLRRGEVSGAGRKPFKQKGTGRARQGSIRAPQMTGGGIVHGPHPRDYAQRTPKKMIAAALRGALSDRARGERIHIVDSLSVGDKPSTKAIVALLNDIATSKHVLIVLERDDEVSYKSVRNVPSVHVLPYDQLNAYDVLVSDDIVFTKGAFDAFVAGPVKQVDAEAVESAAPRFAKKRVSPERAAANDEGKVTA